MALGIENIIQGALAFFGGGAAKTLFDYLTSKKKIEAEAGRIEAEDDNMRVKTAMEIADREREYGDRMDAKNQEQEKRIKELTETIDRQREAHKTEVDQLREINAEKARMILDLHLKLDKCNSDLRRITPDNDRERGRRGEGIP